MSIFNQVPSAELATRFKYRGWFAFCPVYIDDIHKRMPMLTERNWVPEWVMTAAELFQVVSVQVIDLFRPGFETTFMIVVTGEISPR